MASDNDRDYGLEMPFWIDTDAYTDRDREMFVAGVEFQPVQPLIESYRELAVQRERRAVELASENAKLQQDNELLTSLLKALGDEAVAEYRRLYEVGELTGPDNQSEVRG